MNENDFETVSNAIDAEKDFLNSISQDIWKNPELNFKEVYAHDLLTSALTKFGFKVQKNYLLDTAFRAEYSSGSGPTICVCLEYDALPSIGHACGHNLIAEAGLAAGIGIQAAMKADSSIKGKVVLMGTPAEEQGGGKIKLINHKAFEDIDAAMMVHPSCITSFKPAVLGKLNLTVNYKGKEAHAAAFPWAGINALDAAVILYQSIGLLRQQMKPSNRIHVIITKGGDVANIIPADTSLEINLRAKTKVELASMRSKIEKCIEGAAFCTSSTYETQVDEENIYDDLLTNETISGLFKQYAENLGLKETDLDAMEVVPTGSTDMGNVSYTVPTIHPFYCINKDALNHTKDFATASMSEEAQLPTLNCGKAMAMTALALMRDPKKLEQAKNEFKKQIAQSPFKSGVSIFDH